MKSERFTMRINGLSAIMMLMLLCITVFAALSLVSANSERRLADKNAAHIVAYASADAQAQRKTAELYAIAAGTGDYHETADALKVAGYTVAQDGAGYTVEFETTEYDNLKIQAVFILGADNGLTMTRYRAVNTGLAATTSQEGRE